MAIYEFDDLLCAISSAVQSTNKLAENQYADYIEQHFGQGDHGIHTPRTFDVLLPARHIQEGENSEQIHQIPTACLSSPQTMAVDELTLSMDCSVSSLSTAENGDPRLRVVLGKGGAQPMNLQITYKNGDPPEGLARVNDALLKKF